MTQSWPERAILSRLIYYFQLSKRNGKPRARVRWNGHLWVAKCDDEMARETTLSKAWVKKLRERLKKRGLIYVEHHRFGYAQYDGTIMLRVCHYRINWDALEQAYLDGGGDCALLLDQEDPVGY